jgi:hypothetical protein
MTMSLSRNSQKPKPTTIRVGAGPRIDSGTVSALASA